MLRISSLIPLLLENSHSHLVLRYGEYQGLGIYVIEAPHLYQREGNPYHDANYNDYADNYKRFALLGWVGAELADGLDSWWRAEVVQDRKSTRLNSSHNVISRMPSSA